MLYQHVTLDYLNARRRTGSPPMPPAAGVPPGEAPPKLTGFHHGRRSGYHLQRHAGAAARLIPRVQRGVRAAHTTRCDHSRYASLSVLNEQPYIPLSIIHELYLENVCFSLSISSECTSCCRMLPFAACASVFIHQIRMHLRCVL